MSQPSLEKMRAFLRGKKKAVGHAYRDDGDGGTIEEANYAGLCVCCGRWVKHVHIGGRAKAIFDTDYVKQGHVWMVCSTQVCLKRLEPPQGDMALWDCPACNFFPQIGEGNCINCGDDGTQEDEDYLK